MSSKKNVKIFEYNQPIFVLFLVSNLGEIMSVDAVKKRLYQTLASILSLRKRKIPFLCGRYELVNNEVVKTFFLKIILNT